MAGIDGGGGGFAGSMDYEYDSQSAPAFQADSMRAGGRTSRCPGIMHSSWSPFSAASYHGSPAHSGWQQGPLVTNHLSGFHSQHMSLGYSAHPPARAPLLPDHLPDSRGPYLSPQEIDVPPPAVHIPSGYAAGVPLQDSSPSATTTSSSGATSAAGVQVSPSSRLSPSHARGQPVPSVESTGPEAYSSSSSSSSPPASTVNAQARSAALNPAQREDQSSSDRSSQPYPTARVRLPAPGNTRPRMPPTEQRLTATLGHYARFRDAADYYEAAEYEAAHAPASQTSDDDSDRDIGPSAFASVSQVYLRNARQSQILRGQMNNKRVASKKAIQSLQKVDVDNLPDTEKTCVICYNDFGVASPEGTVETPLRLPKCKHVFGNQCILKWLEESNSCPYCRDKLESEMARPDQDTIRRMLIESELAHMPPSIRHRVYRTQTSDRVEARAEAQSLLRARQRAFEAQRDSISRGERRAAPLEDSSDAQRRQRPRFSTDSFSSLTTSTSTQSPSPAQRTLAWQQGPASGNLWAMNPQSAVAANSPGGHLPRYAFPSFPMTNHGFSHDFNGLGIPSMFSREDLHTGPQHSDLAQTGLDGSRTGPGHDYALPRLHDPFARQPHPLGDPFHRTAPQQNNQRSTAYPNLPQPVRHDGQSQGGAFSSLQNDRN